MHYPTSIGEAISLLSQYGQQAAVISGGTDLISRNKNRIKLHTFTHFVDITGLNLGGITKKNDGFHIGATTPINQVATDADIASSSTVLSQAATQVATLQIRNMGTVGGDVLQEVWCPYLEEQLQLLEKWRQCLLRSNRRQQILSQRIRRKALLRSTRR